MLFARARCRKALTNFFCDIVDRKRMNKRKSEVEDRDRKIFNRDMSSKTCCKDNLDKATASRVK